MKRKRIPWNKGKTGVYSKETLRKISEASKRKVYTEEYRAKIGKASRGRKHTKETKEKMRLSKLGSKNPMYGGLTKKHKDKISNGLKGRVFSIEHKQKLSNLAIKNNFGQQMVGYVFSKESLAKRSGKNHGNWKGGITPLSAIERNKTGTWRLQVFERDNYTCQICFQYNTYLHADHIKQWSKYPNLRFELSNGRTLCRACHYYVTFKRKMPKDSRWGLVFNRSLIKD